VGNGMENIIFGPWKQCESGLYREKLLEDGQIVKVPEPPSSDSAAVIPQSLITLSPHEPSLKQDEHALKGVIAQLSLEPAINSIMVSIRTGNQTFTLRIPQEKARETALFPGQSVYIAYPLSAVIWH